LFFCKTIAVGNEVRMPKGNQFGFQNFAATLQTNSAPFNAGRGL
jgi:hypothetical protein